MNPTYDYPLFETFWNNTGLRGSLFDVYSQPPNDQEREDALNDFIDMVNSFDVRLLNFIQIK